MKGPSIIVTPLAGAAIAAYTTRRRTVAGAMENDARAAAAYVMSFS